MFTPVLSTHLPAPPSPSGLGFVLYWSQPFNILDGLIVMVSLIEIIMLAVASGSGAKGLQVGRV